MSPMTFVGIWALFLFPIAWYTVKVTSENNRVYYVWLISPDIQRKCITEDVLTQILTYVNVLELLCYNIMLKRPQFGSKTVHLWVYWQRPRRFPYSPFFIRRKLPTCYTSLNNEFYFYKFNVELCLSINSAVPYHSMCKFGTTVTCSSQCTGNLSLYSLSNTSPSSNSGIGHNFS